MRKGSPRTIHLQDYRPPAYLVDETELYVDLHEEYADVRNRMRLRRNPEGAGGPLFLNGEHQELLAVTLDGRTLDAGEYRLDDEGLHLDGPPERCELTVTSRNRPQDNTALEGLYRSQGDFFTQCEAEGFRRITFFPDRPDVMARFRTTIEADSARYPVLLSNGNPVDRGDTGDGRHWVTWEDPFPKPCYLFALVAGDLARVEEHFTTRSGRDVPLHLYVRHGDEPKAGHALASLKKAMRWDEETFGLEYDLDLYMVVAVADFNMGAMENKGLNVFNAKYVLASPETATDRDFENIESVVAHEYFHNWTGNRVTCRDWFQLSLKEGLTVFRERLFADDVQSAAVNRIRNVQMLRSVQFPEDAGPMAHPVQPDSYIEINNFYTPTVYEKGAEVIRMLSQLLGRDGFRAGMELYIRRHDGQAVTIEDFVAAMADANDRDLDQFMHWYRQAGTPVVAVEREHDAGRGRYRLTLRQSCPPTPDQPGKQPFHIPVAVGLLDSKGRELPLRLAGEAASAAATTRVLELRDVAQTFEFVDVPEGVVPSLLRDFSAPVKLDVALDDVELRFLMAHDPDPFNRWEAGQRLLVDTLLDWTRTVERGERPRLPDGLSAAVEGMLADHDSDPALRAEALRLPGFDYLAELLRPVPAAALDEARQQLRRALAESLRDTLLATLEACQPSDVYRFEPGAVARRSLAAVCLFYLAVLDDQREEFVALCERQYRRADNMSDALAALAALTEQGDETGDRLLESFYQRWRDDPLVLDKWFQLQATSSRADVLDRVRALTAHPAYERTNPNRVIALVGGFSRGNPGRFHDAGGEGYRFLADQVLELSTLNPSLAARLLIPLRAWRRYAEPWCTRMKAELKRIADREDLPPDVYEVVTKSLAD